MKRIAKGETGGDRRVIGDTAEKEIHKSKGRPNKKQGKRRG